MARDARVMEFGGFRLDVAERSLSASDGREIQLSRRLFDVLLHLVARPGRLVEKQALLDEVWAGLVVEENTLSRTISALRRALGERAGDNRFIATVPGVGYRFVQNVALVEGPRGAEPKQAHSIAVLPFKDLSSGHDQQYFAAGIAEEILNRLARITDLRVIARTSSFQFQDTLDDASAIAERLEAGHVLTGAVRKDGARLRINVQLLEASSNRQVWAQQFDRALADVFATQDEIARAVAIALSATLVGDMRAMAQGGTTNLDAYDLYLRAVSSVNRSGGPALLRAAELAREAIALDPEFASAWLVLAVSGRAMLIFLPERSGHVRGEIEAAAEKAVALAPESWFAHVAQSVVHHSHRNWRRMEHSLTRASALVPSMPSELGLNFGVLRAQVGDFASATEHLREGVRSDPMSLMISGVYQVLLLITGQHDQGEQEYRRSLELPGDRDMVEHLALHRAWARDGDFREPLRRYLDHQSLSMPVLAEVYEHYEQPRCAVAKLLEATHADEYCDPMRQMMLAWWLARYDEADAAFASLWRAYVDLQYPNLSLLWFPVFSAVRRDPRFKHVLSCVGLADYWRARGKWGDYCRRLPNGDFELMESPRVATAVSGRSG